MTTELTEALARIHADIRLAIADPGSVIPRNYLYEMPETIPSWSAHAVLASPALVAFVTAREAAARREALLEAAHSSECAFDGDAMAGLIDALEEERAKVARVEAVVIAMNDVPDFTPSDYDRGRVDQRHDDAMALWAALAEPERDEEGGR